MNADDTKAYKSSTATDLNPDENKPYDLSIPDSLFLYPKKLTKHSASSLISINHAFSPEVDCLTLLCDGAEADVFVNMAICENTLS